MPLQRPRRNRRNETIRSYHRETKLSAEHFVYPVFIHEEKGDHAIGSMPGCYRLGKEGLLRTIDQAVSAGIRSFVFFPAIPDTQKTPGAEESYNLDGLVPRTLQLIKEQFPEVTLITDVALDPYSSDGHDGLVSPEGKILNDETVEVLCAQAVCQAKAGADFVAPSDMMDGRVGAIRLALDNAGFSDVGIISYTVKYASAFYGPFREALDSAPRFGDKKTYQMDPANRREAMREVALDEAEGADMLMVKPAGPFLDVIAAVRAATVLPIAAYQVSGEYAMLKAASANGWLDEKRVVLESLLGIKRAGADIIFTYYAIQAANWLNEC